MGWCLEDFRNEELFLNVFLFSRKKSYMVTVYTYTQNGKSYLDSYLYKHKHISSAILLYWFICFMYVLLILFGKSFKQLLFLLFRLFFVSYVLFFLPLHVVPLFTESCYSYSTHAKYHVWLLFTLLHKTANINVVVLLNLILTAIKSQIYTFS